MKRVRLGLLLSAAVIALTVVGAYIAAPSAVVKAAGEATSWNTNGNSINNSAFLGTTNNKPLALKTNNTERMRILSNGNVGIGTSNPITPLELAKGRLRLSDPSGIGDVEFTEVADLIAHADATSLSPTDPAFRVDAGTNFQHVLTVLNNGSVGIGTTTPCSSSKLHAFQGSTGIGCTGASVLAEAPGNIGVEGVSGTSIGVEGRSGSGNGVYAYSNSSTGMTAVSASGAHIIEGYDAGGANLRFYVERATGNVKADGSFSGPADFAEMMPITGPKDNYTLGDVLIIGPDGNLARSDKPNATNLAGVYSARPGFLGDTEIAAHGIESADSAQTQERVAVALVGIVPVKVTDENGAINPGDLLTTSSTPGYAMRAKPVVINGVEIYPTGTILGKALEAWQTGSGLIQVLITLR